MGNIKEQIDDQLRDMVASEADSETVAQARNAINIVFRDKSVQMQATFMCAMNILWQWKTWKWP